MPKTLDHKQAISSCLSKDIHWSTAFAVCEQASSDTFARVADDTPLLAKAAAAAIRESGHTPHAAAVSALVSLLKDSLRLLDERLGARSAKVAEASPIAGDSGPVQPWIESRIKAALRGGILWRDDELALLLSDIGRAGEVDAGVIRAKSRERVALVFRTLIDGRKQAASLAMDVHRYWFDPKRDMPRFLSVLASVLWVDKLAEKHKDAPAHIECLPSYGRLDKATANISLTYTGSPVRLIDSKEYGLAPSAAGHAIIGPVVGDLVPSFLDEGLKYHQRPLLAEYEESLIERLGSIEQMLSLDAGKMLMIAAVSEEQAVAGTAKEWAQILNPGQRYRTQHIRNIAEATRQVGRPRYRIQKGVSTQLVVADYEYDDQHITPTSPIVIRRTHMFNEIRARALSKRSSKTEPKDPLRGFCVYDLASMLAMRNSLEVRLHTYGEVQANLAGYTAVSKNEAARFNSHRLPYESVDALAQRLNALPPELVTALVANGKKLGRAAKYHYRPSQIRRQVEARLERLHSNGVWYVEWQGQGNRKRCRLHPTQRHDKAREAFRKPGPV